MAAAEIAGAPQPSANAESWSESQRYELDFWKNRWPYRDWSLDKLQELRLADAAWVLRNLGFTQTGPRTWEGFTGSVLEVGCGPIGFFELVEGVQVTANDSLMAAYAAEIPYATMGRRGSANYVGTQVQDFTQRFRFVLCSNVLDHTADWMEFLELLTNRVEPGGQLLLITDTRGRPMPGHTQVFSPAQLQRALRWLGMKTVHCWRVDEKKKDDHKDYQVFARVSA